jgi:20S proteasome subunit beta 1
MCVITESGVERIFIPGNELPRFWEGKEILPSTTTHVKLRRVEDVEPMAIEV